MQQKSLKLLCIISELPHYLKVNIIQLSEKSQDYSGIIFLFLRHNLISVYICKEKLYDWEVDFFTSLYFCSLKLYTNKQLAKCMSTNIQITYKQHISLPNIKEISVIFYVNCHTFFIISLLIPHFYMLNDICSAYIFLLFNCKKW